jgi:parallel beta-helix repeat protein
VIDRIISRLAIVASIAICLLVVIGGQSVAVARTYSVSKSGSDSNPGTDGASFLTIQKASSLAVAGDMIIIKAGTYSEMIEPANNGQPGSPITYQTYPGANVVIDGTGQNPAVNLRGHSYIVFDGLEVAYGTMNISLRDASFVEVKNSILRDATQSSALNGRGAAFCTVRNNQVLRGANCGILFEGGAHDNLIEYNTVKDTAANDGLSLGSTTLPAGTNNVFQYNDSSGSAEDGLDFYTGDYTVIRGNVLHNNTEKGLNIHGGSNCLVENNLVYSNGWYGLYLGTQYGPGQNNTVQNNLFYDNGNDPGAVIDAPNNTLINNTFVARQGSARELIQLYDSATGTGFYNNVFYNGSSEIFSFMGSVVNLRSDNNLFYTTSRLGSRVGATYANLAAWKAGTGYDAHSVAANPLFGNYQNNDFTLRSGSPAKDAGTGVGAPTTDILGNARGASVDIGAYEFQAQGSLPPVVTFNSPANGAVVSGLVNIGADASDDLAVTKVEFYIDGELDSTDTVAPYQAAWYTTYFTKGNHTITAKAYDAIGNIGTATVTVSVNSQVTGSPGNNDVLVKFKTGTSQTAINNIIQRLGLTTKKILLTNWYQFTVPAGTSVAHMTSLLLNEPEVEFAEINFKRGTGGDEVPIAVSAGENASASNDQMVALDLAGLTTVMPSAQSNVSEIDANVPAAAGAHTITDSAADLRGDKLQSAGKITTYGLTAVWSLLAMAGLSFVRRVLIA